MLDTFVYSWMYSNNLNYEHTLDSKLSTFQYEEEHIEALKNAFLICAQEIKLTQESSSCDTL